MEKNGTFYLSEPILWQSSRYAILVEVLMIVFIICACFDNEINKDIGIV